MPLFLYCTVLYITGVQAVYCTVLYRWTEQGFCKIFTLPPEQLLSLELVLGVPVTHNLIHSCQSPENEWMSACVHVNIYSFSVLSWKTNSIELHPMRFYALLKWVVWSSFKIALDPRYFNVFRTKNFRNSYALPCPITLRHKSFKKIALKISTYNQNPILVRPDCKKCYTSFF